MDLLQQVPDRDGLNHAVNQGSGEGEARVVLDTLQGSCDDRDASESGILEGLAQQTNVVGGTAHATGLGEEEGGVVQVVFARLQCRDELTNDDDGGETGIVVDHRQAEVDVLPGSLLQHLDVVTGGAQSCLRDRGLVRGELGHQDGVGRLHVLGEGDPVVGKRMGHQLAIVAGAFLRRGLQGAHPNTGCTQVRYLVNLESGVDAVTRCQDLAHLVGGDGVQSATEGVELDELEIGAGAHEGGCLVEAGVEHPLVTHTQRTL